MAPCGNVRVPKESPREATLKASLSFRGAPSILLMPVPLRSAAAVKWGQPQSKKQSAYAGWWRQHICAADGGDRLPQPVLGSLETMNTISLDIELYSAGFQFCSDMIVTVLS